MSDVKYKMEHNHAVEKCYGSIFDKKLPKKNKNERWIFIQ